LLNLSLMIFIGADHRGRALLENLTRNLAGLELDYKIIGEEFYSDEDDYTDFAKEVALKILGNLDESLNESFGILLCGSGQGVAIAANRFNGIRAGVCRKAEEIEISKADDNINVLCLPVTELVEDDDYNLDKMIRAFIETKFKSDPKYQRRIDKLDSLPNF
jgi:ribose 5-phosphate isomerase B